MKTSPILLSSVALLLFGGAFATAAAESKKKDSAPPPASKPAGLPPSPVPTSNSPVVPSEDFKTTLDRMKAEKAAIKKTHQTLLAERRFPQGGEKANIVSFLGIIA